MSKPQVPSLTLKRKLKAPAEKVFAAWADTEKIVHWFGPAETTGGSVRADMDVRVGGCFRISFKTQDGESHEVGGTYQEVVPNERLVFSWAWHSTRATTSSTRPTRTLTRVCRRTRRGLRRARIVFSTRRSSALPTIG